MSHSLSVVTAGAGKPTPFCRGKWYNAIQTSQTNGPWGMTGQLLPSQRKIELAKEWLSWIYTRESAFEYCYEVVLQTKNGHPFMNCKVNIYFVVGMAIINY